MAIRNNLLGGTDIQHGEVEFKSVDYNDTNNELVRHNVNNYRANALNLIRQLQDRTLSFSADGGEWAEAYVDNTGRLNSVDSASAVFDTNKYKADTSSTEPSVITHNIPTRTLSSTINTCVGSPLVADWEDGADIQYKLVTEIPQQIVEIEATNLNMASFQGVNDCNIKKVSSNKWVMWIPKYFGYTDAEVSARLMSTLFYHRNDDYQPAYNPRVSDIEGLVSIKTSDSNFQNKKVVYARQSLIGSGSTSNRYYTGTFSDTTNNDGTTFLARISNSFLEVESYLQVPSGTTIFSRESRGTSSALLSDNTDWNIDNPSNIRLWNTQSSSNSRSSINEVLVFFNEGTISWETSGTRDVSRDNVDLLVDESVPVMGSVSVSEYYPGVEDSGWLDANKVESFTAFTIEPAKCIVKLIPKETSPTDGYPSISGFALYGDKQ